MTPAERRMCSLHTTAGLNLLKAKKPEPALLCRVHATGGQKPGALIFLAYSLCLVASGNEKIFSSFQERERGI